MSNKQRKALLTIANYNSMNYEFGTYDTFGSIWFLDANRSYGMVTVNYYPMKDSQRKTGDGEWFHALKHVTPPDWIENPVLGPDLLVSGEVRTYNWLRPRPDAPTYRDHYVSMAYGDGKRWTFMSKKSSYRRWDTHGFGYVQVVEPTGYTKLSDDLYQIHLTVTEWSSWTTTFPYRSTKESDWDEFRAWGLGMTSGSPIYDSKIKQLSYDPYDVTIPELPSTTFDYRHNEWHNFSWMKEFGMISNFYSSGYAQAYVDMCDDIPRFHSNQIANIFECLELIISLTTSILSGNFVKAILNSGKNMKDARNAYLAWRYSYNTTKSDVDELTSATARLKSLTQEQMFHIRGVHIDGDALFRCSCMISLNQIYPQVNEISTWMDKYGLELTAEKGWDLVPFSFMVDWVLHVSDWLHQLETIKKYGLVLSHLDVWVSCRTKYDDQEVYMRHRYQAATRNIPMLPTPSWSASNKTFFMRIGDVISIFSK